MQAFRLRGEILELRSQGRRDEAERRARELVELIRVVVGELSPAFVAWMTIVGQLQAEQGNLAGARGTFDRKDAVFRNNFGERDLRYISSVADSAEALLRCGDLAGARALFERVEAACPPAGDPANPLAARLRKRLEAWGSRRSDPWTVQVSI